MSATTSAPHPRIAELMTELEDSRAELSRTVSALTPAQRDAEPVGNEWSVAQILEHLCIVEDGGGRLMTKLMRLAQENGAYETDSSSVLHALDKFQLLDLNRRIEAPPQVIPSGTVTVAQAMERLAAIRERLLTAMVQASGLALGTVTHPHPLFGPLDGYQWLLVISFHERRHIAQIHRQTAATGV